MAFPSLQAKWLSHPLHRMPGQSDLIFLRMGKKKQNKTHCFPVVFLTPGLVCRTTGLSGAVSMPEGVGHLSLAPHGFHRMGI